MFLSSEADYFGFSFFLAMLMLRLNPNPVADMSGED
jgi:hypothetical protein